MRNMIDFDDYNPYSIIAEDIQNAKFIENASELRHYLNCYGYTTYLSDFLGGLNDKLDNICNYCFGSTKISDLRKNQNLIEEHKNARETKQNAIKKNDKLLYEREQFKNTLCTFGFRKVKLYLTKLTKNNIQYADVYRLALEIEDINIKAKDAFGWVKDALYKKKEELLKQMVELAKQNNINFGHQLAKNFSTNYVIFFDIPNCEQISWHTSDDNYAKSLPLYNGVWDGKECSTLKKLENAITKLFIIHNIL